MSTSQEVHLVIPYGMTFDFGFQVQDENGQPEDLTGWSIQIQFREKPEDDDTTLDLTSSGDDGGITISDPEAGEADVLVGADRTLLQRGQLGRYQAVMINDDDPTLTYPLFDGPYRVDPSVWRAA